VSKPSVNQPYTGASNYTHLGVYLASATAPRGWSTCAAPGISPAASARSSEARKFLSAPCSLFAQIDKLERIVGRPTNQPAGRGGDDDLVGGGQSLQMLARIARAAAHHQF
jgi:hypothetical protein